MLIRVLSQALALLAACAIPASAQYFGPNKVQYDDLTFHVLATPHFDVYYYESERDAAGQAARMAERWYVRLSLALDHHLSTRTPIVLSRATPISRRPR